MAQFTIGPGFFPVAVKVYARHAQNVPGLWDAANEVKHRGMPDGISAAEWQSDNCPNVVFELAGLRAFDGPMAGVMYTRSHLVRDELTALHEEFDREHTGVREVFHHAL